MARNTHPTPEKEIRALHKTYDVAPSGRLFISVPGADLNIMAASSNKVEIEVFVKSQSENEALALTDRVKLRLRAVDKQTVRVEAKSFYQNGFTGWNAEDAIQMRLVIRVPRSFNLDIQATSSHVTLKDLDGKHSVQVSGGSLVASKMGGRMEVFGFGCTMNLENFDGSKLNITSAASTVHGKSLKADQITVRASGCESDLGDLQGQSSLAFYSGTATINKADGPLDAQVHGCDATFHLDQVSDTHLEVCGGILGLHLDKSLSAKLLLVGSDVHLDKAFAFSGDTESNRIDGRLNKGKNLLFAHAASGSIHCIPA